MVCIHSINTYLAYITIQASEMTGIYVGTKKTKFPAFVELTNT
jgi:hypothetical protein